MEHRAVRTRSRRLHGLGVDDRGGGRCRAAFVLANQNQPRMMYAAEHDVRRPLAKQLQMVERGLL